MRQEVLLTGGFYVSDSLPISHQECTNFIPVTQQTTALSQRQLIGSSGIREIADSGGGVQSINRGLHDLAGIPYAINGQTLYRIERSFATGEEVFSMVGLGTIEGTGRVSIADNGNQLMILEPGNKGYIYTVSGGLLEITAPGFRANGEPQHVVFLDGYFICSTDSKKWIVSGLNDGTSWDPLDFGSAESDPDPISAPVVLNNQLFLTGSETTEGFQNIGGAGFPFQRNNIFLDKGCYSPFTLISSNQRYFMIGGGKNERAAIWSYQGGQYVKISTNAIDEVLNAFSDADLNAGFALAWGKRGQSFVSFTVGDRTLVYNIYTGLWHELKSGIMESFDIVQRRWRVNSLVTAYGYTIVGDSQDGRIGILDSDIYKEYENNLVRVFTSPPISNKGYPFRMPAIELTIESGMGNEDAPSPAVSLAISEDAKIFDYERNRDAGKVGEYMKRAIWRKNGRAPRFAILRFRLSDPIKPVVIKLEVDII